MLLIVMMLALIVGFFFLFSALIRFSENIIRPQGEGAGKGLSETSE